MIYLSLAPVVLIVGLLMFAFAKQNANMKELGRLMFFAALLAILMVLGTHYAHVL